MKKICKFNVLTVAMFILISSLSTFGQEYLGDLRNKLITIEMENQPLGSVFRYLIGECDVPIGLEKSNLDRDHNEYYFESNFPSVGRKQLFSADGTVKISVIASDMFEGEDHLITVKEKNANLSAIMDTIVGQMENYEWEINNGVVNIFPKRGRDIRFEKLLRSDVREFSFDKGQAIMTITKSLLQLPEFRTFLEENDFTFKGIRYGSRMIVEAKYGRRLNSSMHFSNLTFRELLNKITRIKGGGWILMVTKHQVDGKDAIDLDI